MTFVDLLLRFEEYTAEWHTPPDVRFEEGDANKDGFLIAEEFARSSALVSLFVSAASLTQRTTQPFGVETLHLLSFISQYFVCPHFRATWLRLQHQTHAKLFRR